MQCIVPKDGLVNAKPFPAGCYPFCHCFYYYTTNTIEIEHITFVWCRIIATAAELNISRLAGETKVTINSKTLTYVPTATKQVERKG